MLILGYHALVRVENIFLPSWLDEGPGRSLLSGCSTRLRFAGCFPREVLYSGVLLSPARGRLL